MYALKVIFNFVWKVERCAIISMTFIYSFFLRNAQLWNENFCESWNWNMHLTENLQFQLFNNYFSFDWWMPRKKVIISNIRRFKGRLKESYRSNYNWLRNFFVTIEITEFASLHRGSTSIANDSIVRKKVERNYMCVRMDGDCNYWLSGWNFLSSPSLLLRRHCCIKNKVF